MWSVFLGAGVCVSGECVCVCVCAQVEDEESSQTKAWRYLFSRLRIRGDLEAEASHPQWNSFKRALNDAQLQESVLKLSIAANYSHGSFLSGDNGRNAAKLWRNTLRTRVSSILMTLQGSLAMKPMMVGSDTPSLMRRRCSNLQPSAAEASMSHGRHGR